MKELTSGEVPLEFLSTKERDREIMGECAALSNCWVCLCQVQLPKMNGCVGECDTGSEIQTQSGFDMSSYFCQVGHLLSTYKHHRSRKQKLQCLTILKTVFPLKDAVKSCCSFILMCFPQWCCIYISVSIFVVFFQIDSCSEWNCFWLISSHVWRHRLVKL